jgi:hypothetical protein
MERGIRLLEEEDDEGDFAELGRDTILGGSGHPGRPQVLGGGDGDEEGVLRLDVGERRIRAEAEAEVGDDEEHGVGGGGGGGGGSFGSSRAHPETLTTNASVVHAVDLRLHWTGHGVSGPDRSMWYTLLIIMTLFTVAYPIVT